jgi:hypothetical protein
MDSLRGPTFLLLLQNLRRGMRANGISNDRIICIRGEFRTQKFVS